MPLLKARISPTPSGFLHEGNLVAFLLQKKLVQKHNALLGLRIDDIDRARYRESYLEDIFRCLAALDIKIDFGPQNADDFHRNYRQELRLKRYYEILDDLKSQDLIYACSCSRKDIESHQGVGCPNNCSSANISLDEVNVVWRLLWPGMTSVTWQDGFMGAVKVNVSEKMGDVVLRRRDGLPAYQITSLADDHDLQIGLIVRGQDLIDSTAVQNWLSERLFGSNECYYFHHQLLLNSNGEKLSKSAGAESIP
ncbi:MAG: glutamate--tRNA ligase family protein, partial [Bacteroidota bacterium]